MNSIILQACKNGTHLQNLFSIKRTFHYPEILRPDAEIDFIKLIV